MPANLVWGNSELSSQMSITEATEHTNWEPIYQAEAGPPWLSVAAGHFPSHTCALATAVTWYTGVISATSPSQPSLLLFLLPSSCFPVWLSGFLPTWLQVPWGLLLSTHFTLVHLLKFFTITWRVCWITGPPTRKPFPLQSMPPLNSPHPQTGWIEIKKDERDFDLLVTTGLRYGKKWEEGFIKGRKWKDISLLSVYKSIQLRGNPYGSH